RVLSKLKLSHKTEPDIEQWKEFLGKLKNPTNEVRIGLVGKYVELPDAYKSIVEGFVHAGAENECKVNLRWISSEDISSDNISSLTQDLDGILVAPGFGERGLEGKIEAVRYAREQQVPFFGICLGMQCAVIEFARNVLGLADASSTEMDADTPHPVIDMMEDQKHITMKGGTKRLGACPCYLTNERKWNSVYCNAKLSQRHSHRDELNIIALN